MDMPPIVSPEEWEAARARMLAREKEHTRARDALAAERRRMPRMAVEKEYRFDGLDVDAEERTAALASHTRGWEAELGELADYARGVAAGR